MASRRTHRHCRSQRLLRTATTCRTKRGLHANAAVWQRVASGQGGVGKADFTNPLMAKPGSGPQFFLVDSGGFASFARTIAPTVPRLAKLGRGSTFCRCGSFTSPRLEPGIVKCLTELFVQRLSFDFASRFKLNNMFLTLAASPGPCALQLSSSFARRGRRKQPVRVRVSGLPAEHPAPLRHKYPKTMSIYTYTHMYICIGIYISIYMCIYLGPAARAGLAV